MALDADGRAPRDRAAASPRRSASSARRPRAASSPSSTTTWWARCASSRSSAATIRATSRWCRSAAPVRCMAARWPSCSGITRVLIPPAPGVLCADGLLAADLKADFSRTLPKAGAVDHRRRARRSMPSCDGQADDWLAAEKVAAGRPRSGPRRPDALSRPGRRGRGRLGRRRVAAVEAAFAAAHQSLYGFTLDAPDRAGDACASRRRAACRRRHDRRCATAPAAQGPQARPHVHFASGTTEVPLFDRATFGAGDRLAGPAIISQLDAATLVSPLRAGGQKVHPSGAIVLAAIRAS